MFYLKAIVPPQESVFGYHGKLKRQSETNARAPATFSFETVFESK